MFGQNGLMVTYHGGSLFKVVDERPCQEEPQYARCFAPLSPAAG